MNPAESYEYWVTQREYALKALATADRALGKLVVREFQYPKVTDVTLPKHSINHDTFIDEFNPLAEVIRIHPHIDDEAA